MSPEILTAEPRQRLGRRRWDDAAPQVVPRRPLQLGLNEACGRRSTIECGHDVVYVGRLSRGKSIRQSFEREVRAMRKLLG